MNGGPPKRTAVTHRKVHPAMDYPSERHPSTHHRAAVISGHRAYLGNGTMIDATGLADDLPRLLAGTLARFANHSAIIIDARPAASYGNQLAAVREAGWQVTDAGPDGPVWTLFHRDQGARTVAVGYRPMMTPARHHILFRHDTDPGTVAVLLDRFATVTGWSWRGTPATTAHAGIRLSWPHTGHQPLWNGSKNGAGRGVGVLHWVRNLTAREREWGFCHTFDANGAYLGAAINAELAWSGLQHTGPIPFTGRLPGYWRLRVGFDWPDDGRPPLVDPRHADQDGAVWVTTPYAAFLHTLGPVDVLDSHTAASAGRGGFPAGLRVLRPWAERIKDARTILGPFPAPLRDVLAPAVKRLYKDAIGGMQRPGMRVHRPDWAHTIIDLWRATIMRRVLAVHASQGVWPVAVKTDSLTYADCLPAPQPRAATRPVPTLTDALTVVGCTVGCGCDKGNGRPDQLGGYKHETTRTTDQWDADHKPATPRIPRQRSTPVGVS